MAEALGQKPSLAESREQAQLTDLEIYLGPQIYSFMHIMCVCMYIYIYTYVANIDVYICMCVYIYIYIYIHMYV